MQTTMRFIVIAAIVSLGHGMSLGSETSEQQNVATHSISHRMEGTRKPVSFLATRQTEHKIHFSGAAPAASPASSPSAEAADDEDGEDEAQAEAAPSVAASFVMPAPAPASMPAEDDTEDIGPQVPVVAVVTIENMDYELLAADQSLHGAVEEVIRNAIADESGDDIESDDVALVSWPGSVRARAVIKPQTDVTSETIVDELKNSSSLSTVITDGLSQLKGIQKMTKGDIVVDVDVMVATMTSSVSKVMSRAKGQKHLSRVYELEQEAAAARQRIGDIAAEEVKIDKQIKDLENEEAFQKMVDERVKQVKKELEAPVFADTIGDMWKEMRMFGSPCLLKYLREEKIAIKARIVEAEHNATDIEEELHDARDDVHEAWYPTPKSGGFKMNVGLATSLAVVAAALL